MLIIEKAGSLIKKKKTLNLIKKKKPNRLIVSQLFWQKQSLSFLVEILEELEEIVVINNQVK